MVWRPTVSPSAKATRVWCQRRLVAVHRRTLDKVGQVQSTSGRRIRDRRVYRTLPSGSREHFGALLFGAYDDHKQLRYVGKVGRVHTGNAGSACPEIPAAGALPPAIHRSAGREKCHPSSAAPCGANRFSGMDRRPETPAASLSWLARRQAPRRGDFDEAKVNEIAATEYDKEPGHAAVRAASQSRAIVPLQAVPAWRNPWRHRA